MALFNLEQWQLCLDRLREELQPQQFSTWILPLQASAQKNELVLLAPNTYIVDVIKERFFDKIVGVIKELFNGEILKVSVEVGSMHSSKTEYKKTKTKTHTEIGGTSASGVNYKHRNCLNAGFTFSNFVEGKSNQLARAAALQVAGNIGKAYNPLFIYGGVGLGKTHLMHAIGNAILEQNPEAQVLYLHSERFVADMVKALQKNTITEFKKFYHSLDALLLDDIQFLAGKERSQEEFFHTFNALFEGQQQIVLTCDRYPKEIEGVAERLKSRFGWGLTVAVEPPELETRMAILLNKAEQAKVALPHEVAFFIAKHIQSNVRELEGALKRVTANAHFTGKAITLDFAKDALKDLLALRARLITIENIQKTVAEYFKIRLADMHSKKRTRSLTRPRQMAMALAKELTTHSLPEIADAFGGRDHTTVLHASRKIKELISSDPKLAEDYRNLLRILSA